MARKAVPMEVRLKVLTEAGYRCAVPTCRTILVLDLHHITPISQGGQNTAENLIVLCPTCHDLHHRGTVPLEAIQVYKGMLVALHNAFDQATIDDLIYLSRSDVPEYYSQDGMLHFRRLIAAGLAEVKQKLWRFENESMDTMNKVVLTERGRLIIAAWKAGDKAALAKALISPAEEAVD